MTGSYVVQSDVVSVAVGSLPADYIVQSGVVSVEVESPSFVDSVLIQGPQGPAGPTGVTGATGSVGAAGAAATVRVQAIVGNGTAIDFQLTVPAAVISSVQVFRNGLAEMAGVGFTTRSESGNTVVGFSTAPRADDEVQVVYQI